MNGVLIFSVLMSLSVAAPTPEDAQAKILSYENSKDGQGNYEFSFETSNGIKRQESGRLVNIGQPDEHVEVQGVYSYTDPDGKLVVVKYRADENGYSVDSTVQLVFPQRRPEAFFGAIPSSAVATLLG